MLKVLWGAAEDDIVDVSKEMNHGLDVWGNGGEGFGDAFAHSKAECCCGKAFTLEDTVSDGERFPDAMAHVDVKVGGRHFHICARAGAREGKM